ncbi:hypothetical protein ACP4OV_022296 [Aristida adscensionis]
MSGDTTPHVVKDFLDGVVQLLSDGSVVRNDAVLLSAGQPIPGPDVPAGVHWKDVVYDAAHGLRARLYRPPAATSAAGGGGKLPVLVYFVGGGYCVGSVDGPSFHAFCRRLAGALPAVVLSVEYRLAPEHRLPAAIDDGAVFLSWLRGQAAAGAEPWLAESADFARTFVSGLSAGANLAHHVVVQAASGRIAVEPARLAGYVLLDPFFGGAELTAAESDPPAGVSLTVEDADKLWRMALPAGATRDHPAANPFGPESPDLEAVALPPALVVAPGRDVLRDRVVRYAARLREMGKAVELAVFEGEQHGFSILDSWGGERRTRS